MERGSDRHGPRADQELAHEVEGLVRGGHGTHAEEWRDPEPSGEDQPDADRAPESTLAGGVPAGMSAADVEERSRVAATLGKDVYPVTGAQAVEQARTNRAPDAVVRSLQRLDPDTTYENMQDIWTALGGGVEDVRS